MKEFGNWLRNAARNAAADFRGFMSGRYGNDQLNMVILCIGLAASILSSLLRAHIVGLAAWAASYALMIWAIFRSLSRNKNARYQENRRFLLLLDRFRDRKNRYFICPRCRQTVRVPRHKGKIVITCPRCKERFERRT